MMVGGASALCTLLQPPHHWAQITLVTRQKGKEYISLFTGFASGCGAHERWHMFVPSVKTEHCFGFQFEQDSQQLRTCRYGDGAPFPSIFANPV